MPSSYDRRTLMGAGVGVLGVLLTGGYAWTQYSRRHDLRIPSFRARNESDGRVELTVVGGTDLDDGYESSAVLEPAGDDDGRDEASLAGPWIKHPRPYAIRATTDDDELELGNRELTDRLEGSGWGVDDAEVTIIVTADGTLESDVSLRE